MTAHPASLDDNDAWLRRIREVRERLFAGGAALPPGPHQLGFEVEAFPAYDGHILTQLLVSDSARSVIEVGLAFGGSALAIGEALVTVAGASGEHLIVDPLQTTGWGRVGWSAIESARLDAIATLIEEPSQVALAQMVRDGRQADAAFVDGDHRFDGVFVDLYFLGRLVRPGGLVIVDDLWMPSIRAATHYFERNLGWTSHQAPFYGGAFDRLKSTGRVQVLRLPDPPVELAWDDFQDF